MKILNPIIDKLQALFPPNRIAILLAGMITAVSGSIAAWLAAHFPDLNFGAAEIAGVLGAAVIITVRLLDRWFDRWQEGERVDYQGDVETAVSELAQSPDVHALLGALGTLEGANHALADLRAKVESGGITATEALPMLDSIREVIANFLGDHTLHDEAPAAAPAPPEPAPPAPQQPAQPTE